MGFITSTALSCALALSPLGLFPPKPEAPVAEKQDLLRGEYLFLNPSGQASVGMPPAREPELRGRALLSRYDRLYRSFQGGQVAPRNGIRIFLSARPEELIRTNFAAGLSSDDIDIMSTFNNALLAENFNGFLDTVETPGWASDKQFALNAMIGARLAQRYDYNRARRFIPRGVVKEEEIFQNLTEVFASTAEGGLPFDPDPQTSGGICTEIGHFLGRVIERQGHKNVVLVVRDTGTDSGHLTVLAQDKNDSSKHLKINYESLSRSEHSTGPRLLNQGRGDTSFNYQLYKVGGQLLADVPSEMQKFIASALHTDAREYDPLAQPTYSIASINLTQGSEDFYLGETLFVGHDPTRANYAGAGLTFDYFATRTYPGKIAVSVFQRRKDDEIHDFVYLEINQKLYTKKINLDKEGHNQLQFGGQLLANGNVHYTREGDNKGDYGIRGQTRLNVEVRFAQNFANKKIELDHRVGAQFVAAVTEARDQTSGTIAFNHGYLTSRVLIELTGWNNEQNPQDPNHDLVDPKITEREKFYLILAATAVISQLSERGQISAGVGTKKWGVLLSLAGRLREESAVYEDGTEHRVQVEGYFIPTDGVEFAGSAFYLPEDDGKGGTLSFKYDY